MDLRTLTTAVHWRWNAFRRSYSTRARTAATFLWRRMMVRTVFIVISGSVGKTTTKELLREVLSPHGGAVATIGNWNHRKNGGLENTVLRVRPWHRFAVIEAAIERPGDLAPVARLVKPDIGVMLAVKRCHTKMFPTEEAIAREKGELIRNLGRRGRAVLNLDDPRVAAMAAAAPGEVVWFGSGQEARIRLLESRSRWPDRLRLRIAAHGREYQVHTRLVGTHWTTAVLATLATADACGIALEDAIARLGDVEPFWARMQPVTLPGSGAVLIRDEWNGSFDTFEAAFNVMEEADAVRKGVIVSDYSDTPTKMRTRALRLGRWAAQFAQLLVFVGDYAERSVAAAVEAGVPGESVHGFATLPPAIAFLKRELRRGDLVLLKGQTSHHLSRIYLGLLGEIDCTVLSCGRQHLCDKCERLGLERRPELDGLVAATDSPR